MSILWGRDKKEAEIATPSGIAQQQLCAKCEEFLATFSSRLFLAGAAGDKRLCKTGLAQVWHFTLPAASELGKHGCTFCQFLRQSIEKRMELIYKHVYQSHKSGSLSLSIDSLDESDRSGGHVVLNATLTRARTRLHRKKGLMGFGWDVYSNDAKLKDKLGLLEPVSAEAWCPKTIEFAKAALTECTSKCPKHTIEPFLPTRLLDTHGNGEGHVKLVISETLDTKSVQYAALSYCWGTPTEAKTQLTTTVESLNERLSCIPYDSLTRVMQDAVIVCRSLDIRYLWIDSLCILQSQAVHGNGIKDAAQSRDWERESQTMGLIFSSAYLTICAANSSSCHDSFLMRSLVMTTVNLENSVWRTKHSCTFVQQQVATSINAGLDGRPLTYDLHGMPWRDRGWVFQERHLSTRMLIFGTSTLHFQCQWLTMTENGYRERHTEPQSFAGILSQWKRSSSTEFDGEKRPTLYPLFRDLIQEYRTTALTYPSDRIPAMQGLIQLMENAIGDICFNGLWKGDLHFDLLWKGLTRDDVSFRSVVAERSKRDFAPSWSWAGEENRLRGYYGVNRFKIHGTVLHPAYRSASIVQEDGDGSGTKGSSNGSILRVVAQAKPLRGDGLGKLKYTHSALGELHTERDGRYSYIAHCDFDFTLSEDGKDLRDLCADALLLFTSGEHMATEPALSIPGQYESEDFLQTPEKMPLDRKEDMREQITNSRDVDAWGLVIYPIPGTNKYIRLETFTSLISAQVKGARMFAGIQYRPYDLV